MFFWKKNTEWDWQSIVDVLDLKLTIMGTAIWKWGVSTSTRDVAHRCWLMRKYLRDIGKAGTKATREVRLIFKDIYGFFPEFDFNFIGNQLKMPLIVPEGFDESKRDEMEKVYQEMKVGEREDRYEDIALKNFCLEFERNLKYLWD
jgi:hypothetical protein